MHPGPLTASAAVVLFAAVILAGCINGSLPPSREAPGSPPSSSAPAAAPGPPATDCSLPGASKNENGVCYLYLDPTEGPDREAHIATHPALPDRVIATWSEGISTPDDPTGYNRKVWGAFTADGGRAWSSEMLSDPGLDAGSPPGDRRFAFDSVAAFGPDGTGYVLFGGEDTGTVSYFPPCLPVACPGVQQRLVSRITLASLRQPGDGWTYSRVVESTPEHGWDFMDLAVAPDSGVLHVVAQSPRGCVPGRGCQGNEIWTWRSTDSGTTWSSGTILHRTALDGTAEWAPRVTAAPDGLVVVLARVFSPSGQEILLRISRDGGGTWGMAKTIFSSATGFMLGDPIATWRGPDDRTRLDVVLAGDNLTLLRSWDGGDTWEPARNLASAPDAAFHLLSAAAAAPDGTLYALHSYGNVDPEQWGLGLVRVSPEGVVEQLLIVGLVAKLPPIFQAGPGDEYMGLSAASDGSAWAAWSDPTGNQTRTAIARFR